MSDAPTLEPPGAGRDPGGGGSGRTLAWVGLILLVAMGVAVVVVLPRIVAPPLDDTGTVRGDLDPSAATAATDATDPPPSAPAHDDGGRPAGIGHPDDVAERAAARVDAEQTLEEFLKLRARLELARAPRWGDPEWSDALTRAAEGDRLFGYQRFAGAAEHYAAATRSLHDLEQGRGARLAEAFERGSVALADDRAADAIAAFELVLAIEPEHAGAAAAIERARVRDRVVEHVAAAERAERGGEIESAREDFAAAVGLDDAYAPAVAGLARVSALIADRAFREAMTRALADIDAGRFDAAAAGLDAAARLRSQDAAVADARRRLGQARLRSELDRLRLQAARGAAAEEWARTVQTYEQALRLAPSSGFAREGIAHARERARLNEQVDFYLADPERLYAGEHLVHAEQLIESASPIPADEPKLEARVEELERNVRVARRPLLVTVRSDGETEVAIYHVARLGRFEERSLELRPGRYTVVGSRPGFRDVRRVIDLRPGDDPRDVVVRCEERI